MIVSKEKMADVRERGECLELMEWCLSKGLTEQAKELGEISRWYAERIKKDNYVELDKKWALYHLMQTK